MKITFKNDNGKTVTGFVLGSKKIGIRTVNIVLVKGANNTTLVFPSQCTVVL